MPNKPNLGTIIQCLLSSKTYFFKNLLFSKNKEFSEFSLLSSDSLIFIVDVLFRNAEIPAATVADTLLKCVALVV